MKEDRAVRGRPKPLDVAARDCWGKEGRSLLKQPKSVCGIYPSACEALLGSSVKKVSHLESLVKGDSDWADTTLYKADQSRY